MKIFLSYPSARHDTAERLQLALEAEGHEVFIDRADLAGGQAFHQPLREAIAAADAMVFLITPASVAAGSYCLSELALAERRWRRPAGRVLPVMLESTPAASLPPYLQAVTVLQPRGDLVAETVAAVAALSPPANRRWRLAWLGGVLLVALAAAGLAWKLHLARAAAEIAARESQQLADEAARLSTLCADGSHATAWTGLTGLVAPPADPLARARLATAREDCAMAWLREARVIGGQQTFAQLTAPLKPVLAAGLAAGARGPRAADLRAHLGWAAFLERREGSGTEDPVVHYRRALDDEPGNVHALAMWGHNLLFQGADVDGGKARLEQAMAGTRETAYAHRMALAVAVDREDLQGWALQIASRMRQRAVALPAGTAQRFWSSIFAWAWRPDRAERWIHALPPADMLATFEWLMPATSIPDDRRDAWRYLQARLQCDGARQDLGRSTLLDLQRRLQAGRNPGGLALAVEAALRRCTP